MFRPIAAKLHTTGEPMPKPHLHSAEHEALAQNPRTGLTRVVFIVAGTLCLALAVVATFVPVLPTTPFLLLATACYMRSSPRLHRWMYTNRLFGEYLTAYRSGRGLPLATKVATLALLWVSIGASAIFGVPASLWWVKLLLLLIAVGVTVHVARLKTLSQT